MRVATALALLLILPLAGCLNQDEAPASPPVVNATAEGGLQLTTMDTGKPTADAPVNTLDAPPVWRQGEWWTVKVTDALEGKVHMGTRVVAGAEPNYYLVGMPRDSFSTELMVLHIPGFGQISKRDLSFDVHNKNFAPLNFPLTDGKTWETAFEGRPVKATAHVKSPTEALVQIDGANDHMNVTYDATLGEIRKIQYSGYADLEVVDHGYDYQGIVTVPHMFKLVFQQARIAAAMGPALGPQPGVDEVVNIDGTYDRVSFVLLLGDLTTGQAPTTLGYYQETVTGPDGKTYEATFAPPETGAYKVAYYSADKPGGDWKFHHVAAGPGLVVAEGIAYHVYDIDLPSGRVLPSTGAHHHGG